MESVSVHDFSEISQVLDRHLEAVKNKDVSALLQVFYSNGFFLGTDDTEQWSVLRLAQRLQKSEHGWSMWQSSERMIWSPDPDRDLIKSAHFIELLTHTKYGDMRGSGVAVRQGDDWKIACYILSFSVPNEAVDEGLLQSLRSP